MLLLGIICESQDDVLLEHKKVECPCAKMLLLNDQSMVQDYDGSPLSLDFLQSYALSHMYSKSTKLFWAIMFSQIIIIRV